MLLYQTQLDELDPRLREDDGLRGDDELFVFIVISASAEIQSI